MDSAYEGSTRHERDAAAAEVARAQHGLVTREQARALGITPSMIQRRLDLGRWVRLHQGVYRVAGAPVTWLQRVMAACLAWGPGAAASHATAATLWRLPGFAPADPHLTVPRARNRTTPGVVVHRSFLPAEDIGALQGIPVTSPARTIVDLAAGETAEVVEEALDDVLRRRLANVGFIERRARALGRRRGREVLGELLRARSRPEVPMSVFETRLLRLLRRAGLPAPGVQHRVALGPRRGAVIDFAYPDRLVAIEADGYAWHAGRQRWERDLARRNALTALGWRIVHVTWTDLCEQPGEVVARIAALL